MPRFKGKKKKNYPKERRNVEEGFIPQEFIDYYHFQFVPKVLSEDEFQIMINTLKQPLSHTFRIVGSSAISSNSESSPTFDPLRAKLHHDIELFLNQIQSSEKSSDDTSNQSSITPNQKDTENSSQNKHEDITNPRIEQSKKVTIQKIECFNDMFGEIYRLSADKPTLRRDPALAPLREWLNVNMKIGNIVRQELVSMVPPFFLDLKRDSRVLDVAAAPGSKTSQILSYVDNGLVVANDVNVSRSTMLVHNLGRLRNLKNEEVIVVSHPAQYLPLFEYMQNFNTNSKLKDHSNFKGESKLIQRFDRVLCDVPCSGDGTLRKNPDACLKFTLENGAELHPIQRAILIRALKHLDEGGTLVYSTCSMNPVEDEAVVSSVVLESKGTIQIKDVSNMFTQMKRRNGLRDWKVMSQSKLPTMYAAYDPMVHSSIQKEAEKLVSDKTDDDSSEKVEIVKDDENNDDDDDDDVNELDRGSQKVEPNRRHNRPPKPEFDFDSLSKSESKVAPGIEHCMRFLPHDNDTGGFFVAVLTKLSNAFDTTINEPRLSHKPPFKWREHPYLPLSTVSPTKMSYLMTTFGLTPSFTSNLFVRDEEESLIRNIFFCCDPGSSIVSTVPPGELRAVSCGVRVFTWKEFKDENTVRAVPCIEGVSLLRKFIPSDNERVVRVDVDDMIKLLKAGNNGCMTCDMKNGEELKKLKVGGLLFVLDVVGVDVCYGGLLLKDSVMLYVKKDMIDQEIQRIQIEIDSLSFLKK